jgi:hypothetical protein
MEDLIRLTLLVKGLLITQEVRMSFIEGVGLFACIITEFASCLIVGRRVLNPGAVGDEVRVW